MKYIKYLGVNISKNLEHVKKGNFDKLNQEIKNKSDDFRTTGLFWFGRIAIWKMKTLPKIVFF